MVKRKREGNASGEKKGKGRAKGKLRLDDSKAVESADAASSPSISLQSFTASIERGRYRHVNLPFDDSRLRQWRHVDTSTHHGPVAYWIQRDQRLQDNWAAIKAQREAMSREVPLLLVFCLVDHWLGYAWRHYSFMLKGLRQLENEAAALGLPLEVLTGDPVEELPSWVSKRGVSSLVTDFSPLRPSLKYLEGLQKSLPSGVGLAEVDAHNVVPAWVASDKQEVGARTLRPKINGLLSQYLTEFPPLLPHPHKYGGEVGKVDWGKLESSLQHVDRSVGEVKWAAPGVEGGMRQMWAFLDVRLRHFAKLRNDPTRDAISGLSPWFHFGHLSPQRAVLEVRRKRPQCPESVASFIEEAVVRRELSDNFCLYNSHYDEMRGAAPWARLTLDQHAKDKRSPAFSREELEAAKTYDPLWNAAQLQMVVDGKMHGFLRMYWAKKILEWTAEGPSEALRIAIELNDKYSLDGSDPNGYVGCMWSVCGVHDMGWAERPIFGKIRFMNLAGCRRKFDVDTFVEKYAGRKKTDSGGEKKIDE